MNGILYLSLVNGCVHRMAIKCVFVAAFDLKDKERERERNVKSVKRMTK